MRSQGCQRREPTRPWKLQVAQLPGRFGHRTRPARVHGVGETLPTEDPPLALAVNDPPIVSSVTFGLRFSTAATCLLIASMQPSRVENA